MNTDRIGRAEARRLAEDEFARFAELAAALTPQEWAMPTGCTAWDARKIALHVLGSADAQASVAEFGHQLRRGLPLNKQIDSHHWVDGLNELQVREREQLSNAELAGQLKTAGPKAAKGRWGPGADAAHPAAVRASHWLAAAEVPARRGVTRDVWCHRIDICHAKAGRWTSRRTTTASSADIVAEWAQLHRLPFDLVTDGRPAAPSATAVTASTSRSTPSTSSARWPAAASSGVLSNRCPCNPAAPQRAPPGGKSWPRRSCRSGTALDRPVREVREKVGWNRDVPAGMRFHVASFGDGVLRMTDVRDSEELSGRFVQTRIRPDPANSASPASPT